MFRAKALFVDNLRLSEAQNFLWDNDIPFEEWTSDTDSVELRVDLEGLTDEQKKKLKELAPIEDDDTYLIFY